MGQTQLICTRATGWGTPEWRQGYDEMTNGNHKYNYGFFGFDRTALGYGVRITNIYSFGFWGQAFRSDASAGVVYAFISPLDAGFADQTGNPPAANRSKVLSGGNAILPEPGGHGFSGAVTDQNVIEKIIRNGIVFGVENDVDNTSATMRAYTDNSAHPPVLGAEWAAVTLSVKKAEVSGAKQLVPGFTYSFVFETEYDAKCVLGAVTQEHAWVGYDVGPSSSENIHDIGTRTGEIFTVPRMTNWSEIAPGANGQPYSPWVYVISNGGVRSATVYAAAAATTSLSITLDDIHPTVTQYAGLPVSFNWKYKYNMPAGAISGSASQIKAEIRWRKKGEQAYTTIAGIGAEMSRSVSGLPAGTIEYQIVSWDTTGGKTESAWKSFENKALAIKAADLYPAAGAKAPKHVANRFGWRVVPDEDPGFTGQLTVQSAVFFWRPAGGGTAHQINAGTASSLTVPAETFTADMIDWWVEITANTGGKAASDPVSISTIDAVSKPVAVSPVGEYVNDAAGVLFVWRHVIETGTPQKGYHLQTSTEGATWNDLAQGDDGTDRYLDGHGSLPTGPIYWHVRTKNTDGAWGTWSETAAIVVQRAPQAPQIVYTDEHPLPTIGWQAMDQEGYRLTIGGFDTGWVASTDKTYTHGDILPDGVYPVTLRIMTTLGEESPAAHIDIEIKNVPGEAPALHIAERKQAVHLRWQPIDGAVYYVLRDGVPVLRTEQAEAWDHFASGAHRYVVRAMKDGNYTDSAPLVGVSRVDNAVISALEPVAWIKLSVKSQSRPTYDESSTGQATFRHFYGRALPVGYTSGFADITSNMTWTLRPEEAGNYDKLRALTGLAIVYKDCFGRVRFGVLTAVSGGLTEQAELSLTITQTDYQERVDYA